MSLNIFDYKEQYDMLLCKVSKKEVGIILNDYVNSITRVIDEIDSMEISIPKYITNRFSFKKMNNPLYEECKEERLLLLNGKEYFVIKNAKNSTDDIYKNVTAYSLEYKLGHIDINIEDISFQLMISEMDKKIYSLNDYLYQETGWKLGHIDDVVRYDIDSTGKKTDKLRIQSGVNKSWYDFLKDDIAVQFGCIFQFDTFNKIINMYDVNTKGEDVQIYLTKDNYIKNLECEGSTEDLATRMFVKGNEEMDIIGSTPTGYNFIENYSYFMDNGEMSDELVYALKTYYKVVEEKTPIWKELVKQKLDKIRILTDKKMELYIAYDKVNQYGKQMKYYESKKMETERLEAGQNKSDWNVKREILEQEVKLLDEEIKKLTTSIDHINELCKYETSRDSEGNLIFNTTLLNDLKDYIYNDTYSNDAFLNVEDLINTAKRELSIKCRPTKSYSIDVADFTKRLISNGFRVQFKGVIDLGNIVMLIDPNNGEEFNLFLVGYTINPNKKDGLQIEICDKKVRKDNTRLIADYLTDAKRTAQELNTKKYLLNKVKYNEINL